MENNWVSYKNGNYIVALDTAHGTKIRYNDLDSFRADRPENIDIKITNRCTNPCGTKECPKNCEFCHENSGPNGKHSDALNSKFIETLPEWTECALGGGNLLEYPDLVPLLYKMKNLHLISNITVNQKHFMENLSLLRELSNQKLIYGLGVSLTNPYEEGFIAAVKTFPNAVIHVINGVVTLAQLSALGCKNLKILILGYKEVRRGVAYKADVDHMVEFRKNRLYASLPFIAEHNWFKTISFDNLAIEQLEPKRFLSDEFYQTHNLGDDGLMGEQTSASYYVDLVENVFARNSCDVNHRYPLENHTATECYQLLRDNKI